MKIGRNDPCHCGSGKKYKKCCLGKENVSNRLLSQQLSEAYDKPMNAVDNETIEEVRSRLELDNPGKPQLTQPYHETALAVRIESIKNLIEDFSHKHLTPEYTNFALNLCDKISLTPDLNIHRGHKAIWAASIVYVIARLNFLFDMKGDLVLTPALICSHFDTVKSTVGNKASQIQKLCGLYLGAKGFCRQEIVDVITVVETPEDDKQMKLFDD